MKLGVSLSGMCQQPIGVDMKQNFKNIGTYAQKVQKLGFEVVNRIFDNQVKLFANRTTFQQELDNMDHYGISVRSESNTVLAEKGDGALVLYFHSTIAGASQHSKIEVYGSEGVIVRGLFYL